MEEEEKNTERKRVIQFRIQTKLVLIENEKNQSRCLCLNLRSSYSPKVFIILDLQSFFFNLQIIIKLIYLWAL